MDSRIDNSSCRVLSCVTVFILTVNIMFVIAINIGSGKPLVFILGLVIGVMIIPLTLVAISFLVKKWRTKEGRERAFFWGGMFVFVGHLGQIIKLMEEGSFDTYALCVDSFFLRLTTFELGNAALTVGLLIALTKLVDWYLLPDQKLSLSSWLEALWVKIDDFNHGRLLEILSKFWSQSIVITLSIVTTIGVHFLLYKEWSKTYSIFTMWGFYTVLLIILSFVWAMKIDRKYIRNTSFKSSCACITFTKFFIISYVCFVIGLCIYELVNILKSVFVDINFHSPSIEDIIQWTGVFVVIVSLNIVFSLAIYYLLLTVVFFISSIIALGTKFSSKAIAGFILRTVEYPGGSIMGISVMLIALGGVFSALK